eukprot:7467099-Heterocapsa_arctica.AAC.1
MLRQHPWTMRRGRRDPVRPAKAPSAEERRRHEVTHLPFAPWCLSCIGGRAKDAVHRRQPQRP